MRINHAPFTVGDGSGAIKSSGASCMGWLFSAPCRTECAVGECGSFQVANWLSWQDIGSSTGSAGSSRDSSTSNAIMTEGTINAATSTTGSSSGACASKWLVDVSSWDINGSLQEKEYSLPLQWTCRSFQAALFGAASAAPAPGRPYPGAQYGGLQDGGLLLPPGAPLASTGRSSVHWARWANSPAVAKVMHTHQDHAAAFSHAMEMAVLSSVHHPNIVQAYCCMTDMVQAPEGMGDDNADSVMSVASEEEPSGAEGGLQFLPLGSPEAGGGGGSPLVFNIVVMELCEHGTLQEALLRGAFAGNASAPAPSPAPSSFVVLEVISVLLDVASALKYLHSINLVHGMLKAENVLLKTDPSHPCGFIAKLGGFGSASLVSPDGVEPDQPPCDSDHPACPRGAGCPSGGPSEGPRAEGSLESDVRGFGSLILEVLQSTCAPQPRSARSCAGAGAAALAAPGPVPAPPAGLAPLGGGGLCSLRSLACLAAECLHPDPSLRPTMCGVVRVLEDLSDEAASAVESAAA